MPSSSKPRKKHRPRLVARPVYAQMHRDLVTPPRAAILALERVSDRESRPVTLWVLVSRFSRRRSRFTGQSS